MIGSVNTGGFGSILNPRRLKRHREESGTRFYANRLYSLPAYIGWLHDKHREKLKNSLADQYETHKERMAERSRLKSLASRDIGEIPEPLHAEIVEACRYDLAKFCKSFLPGWFPKPFADQHLEVIAQIQHIVLNGGQQAMALPRHRGKTTITTAACLWATLYGHRRYVVWLAAQEEMSEQAVDGFWLTLRSNQKIVEAFPKICYPLVKGGSDQRSSPLYHGRELNMGRSGNQIIFPDIDGSEGESTILETGGLLTAVRGLWYVRPDGTIARPDLAVLDDPQTDESAASITQCDKREDVINQAVLGLTGPGIKMAAVMPCTVIRHGDLSSRFLDRELNPEWHGIIGKALDSLPTSMDMWDRYNNLRIKSLNTHHDIRLGTEYYRKHQQEMDEGAVATWLCDFEEDEISAIQHEMNEYYRDREYFFAERQNCPLQAFDSAVQLDARKLIQRTSTIPRGIIPDGTASLTGFVDVHQDILYWMIVAWQPDFSGHIAAYGTWPDQRSSYFNQRNVDFKMAGQAGFMSKSFETQLEMALIATLEEVDKEWKTESGDPIRIKLCLIDANWAESTAIVDRFVSTSAWKGRVYPSHGKAIKIGNKTISEWKHEKRDLVGPVEKPTWKIPIDKNGRPWRHVVYDTNIWKTSVAESLMNPPGGAASLVLHQPIQQYDHRLIVDHFTAEKREQKSSQWRTADEWSMPKRTDNHWWDCYSDDTEVLTRCGWKLFADLVDSDELATKNLATQFLEYQRPKAIISRHYKGEMVQVGGKDRSRLDLLVTPNHRMVVYKGQRGLGPTIVCAKDLTIWDKVDTHVEWDGLRRESVLVPAAGRLPAIYVDARDLARLCGWLASEGWHGHQQGTYRTIISQCKPDAKKRILSLLARLPWQHFEHSDGFTFSNRQVYDIAVTCGSLAENKCVPQWIKDSDKTVIEAFLETAIDGDGWVDKERERLASTSMRFADDIAELFIKRGQWASQRVRKAAAYTIRGNSGESLEKHQATAMLSNRLYLRDGNNNPAFGAIDYDGMVYCASVPNGTLIVRRNGKIAICGNCLVGCAVAASICGIRKPLLKAARAVLVEKKPRRERVHEWQ